MTVKQAKERLRTAQKLKQEIKALYLELEHIESSGTQVTSPPSHTKTSPTNKVSSKVEDAAIEIIECEDKIEKCKNNLAEIESEITGISDPEFRAILRLYYLVGLTWEEICNQMHYSWTAVHGKHNQALEEYTKMY